MSDKEYTFPMLGQLGRSAGAAEATRRPVELVITDDVAEMLVKTPHVATISAARVVDEETGESTVRFANVVFLSPETVKGGTDIDPDFVATLVGNAMNAVEGFLGERAFEFGLMVYLARRMKDAVTAESLKSTLGGKDN